MQSIERPADIIAKTASNDGIVKNAWYLAAWSDEVSQELLPRRIAEEPMVFYRSSDGTAAALLDRCPHRKYPLSAGKLDGDLVQCGYHGFRFDTDGTCLSVPGQVKVPLSANVRSFPLVEQFGQIWVYPGDAALADPAKIPHVPWTSEWWSTTGLSPLNARASLLIDNLLDLSPELASRARGLTQDPFNPLFREVGKNYLKSRLRSHPDVARRYHADLLDPATTSSEPASAY